MKEGVTIRPYVLHTHPNSCSYTRNVRHISGIISNHFVYYVGIVDLTISAIQRTVPLYGHEISYLIDIPVIRGKFCPEKAIALGVPKGALFKTLSSGGSVVINGQTITSEMVMAPATRGPCLLLLSLHSSSSVEALRGSQLERKLCEEPIASSLLGIIHSSPYSLRSLPSYIAFLQNVQQAISTRSIAQLTLPDMSSVPLSVNESSSALHRHMHSITPPLFADLVADLVAVNGKEERSYLEGLPHTSVQWCVMVRMNVIGGLWVVFRTVLRLGTSLDHHTASKKPY